MLALHLQIWSMIQALETVWGCVRLLVKAQPLHWHILDNRPEVVITELTVVLEHVFPLSGLVKPAEDIDNELLNIKPDTTENCSAPFCAALWNTWQGQPLKYIEGLQACTWTMRELHTLILTDVLSTPTVVQFIHGFSIPNNFTSLPFMPLKISCAVELAVGHMSRKYVLTEFTSKIWTVIGFIFSRPELFDPSTIIENALTFIFPTSSDNSEGAIAPFSTHIVLVEAEWYWAATLLSPNWLLIAGDNLSWNAIGIFWCAQRRAIFTSDSIIFSSSLAFVGSVNKSDNWGCFFPVP